MPRPLVLLLVGCLVIVSGSRLAVAGPIDDAVAKAAKLQQQLDANGALADLLSERLDRSRIELDLAEAGVRSAGRRIATDQRRVERLRRQLEHRAVQMYERAGRGAGLPASTGPPAELGRSRQYISAADGRDDHLVHELHRSLRDLASEQSRKLAARRRAEDESTRLDAARRRVEEADTFQRLLLDQAKGELAGLLAQEQARQEQSSLVAAASREYSATDAVPQNAGASAAVQYAVAQLGKPYVYAAAGPDQFDCSGLTMMAWRKGGVDMPHYTGSQYAMFPKVSLDALEPGDLVFFYHDVHHVGLYIGGGRMINAPHTGDVVRIAGIYRDSLAGAVRPTLAPAESPVPVTSTTSPSPS